MKVQELVEKYKKNKMMDLKKELEVQEYISISAKELLARAVLDGCVTEMDNEVRINSLERYILFTISVIELHTNLDFSDKEDEDYSALDDYDALCELGLIEKIIGTFKKDYDACETVLNMMTSDVLQSNMTIEKKIYNFLDTIGDILQNSLGDMVNVISGTEGIDENKLVEIYNAIKDKNN